MQDLPEQSGVKVEICTGKEGGNKKRGCEVREEPKKRGKLKAYPDINLTEQTVSAEGGGGG